MKSEIGNLVATFVFGCFCLLIASFYFWGPIIIGAWFQALMKVGLVSGECHIAEVCLATGLVFILVIGGVCVAIPIVVAIIAVLQSLIQKVSQQCRK